MQPQSCHYRSLRRRTAPSSSTGESGHAFHLQRSCSVCSSITFGRVRQLTKLDPVSRYQVIDLCAETKHVRQRFTLRSQVFEQPRQVAITISLTSHHVTTTQLLLVAHCIWPICAVDAAVAVMNRAAVGTANTLSVEAGTTITCPLSNVYVVPPGTRM